MPVIIFRALVILAVGLAVVGACILADRRAARRRRGPP